LGPAGELEFLRVRLGLCGNRAGAAEQDESDCQECGGSHASLPCAGESAVILPTRPALVQRPAPGKNRWLPPLPEPSMARIRLSLALTFPLAPLAAAQEKKEPPKQEEKKDERKPTKEEQELTDLTNAERKKAGLKPLTANPQLMAAARGHAENMAKQEKLEHTLDD